MGVSPPPAPRPPASAATAPAPPLAYAGFSRVDRLKGNVGYIKLQNFPDPAGPFSQTANKAMTDLAGTDALIIDMRENGGGSFEGVLYLCSFFFDPTARVHIGSLVSRKPGTNIFDTKEFHTHPVDVSYLGKPVYVLTGKRTFSAAEKFLYDMQAQKRARLVGEVTRGGANSGATNLLPFRFLIGIPNQRSVNAVTQTDWEGTGAQPDLAVDESLAFRAAMREIVASNPARYAGAESRNRKPERHGRIRRSAPSDILGSAAAGRRSRRAQPAIRNRSGQTRLCADVGRAFQDREGRSGFFQHGHARVW
jgi:C-terminal processing protease CtpA/Prc